MIVDEADQPALREWITPRLRNLLDIDSDAPILAEYIVAVLGNEHSEEDARKKAAVELSDFLADRKPCASCPYLVPLLTPADTEAVVDAVLEDIRSKAFLTQPPPFNPPTGPKKLPGLGNFAGNGAGSQSRKRSYMRRETSEERDPQDSHYARNAGGERPTKQTARRGGQSSRGGFGGDNMSARGGFGPASYNAGFPQPPPAFSNVPADPMALFTLATAMNMGISGFPPALIPPGTLLALPSTSATTRKSSGRKQRCSDYDNKGFCMRGARCQYEHGQEATASLDFDFTEVDDEYGSGGNRGKGTLGRSSRSRAPFYLRVPGPNRSNTTVVVQQIPQENLNDTDIRQFFSQFGNVQHIEMRPRGHLAIVTYWDDASASRAIESPKPVFDNRFVNVSWYRPETSASHNSGNVDMLDPETIAQRQHEAQVAFEERKKKREESAAKMAEIDVQLKTLEDELYRLKTEIAVREGGKIPDAKETAQAKKQAHLDTPFDSYDQSNFRRPPAYRGRGGYRGRGYTPFRGGYSGFGGVRSSVKRLDNRPKSVLIAGFKVGSAQDEALRQHLFNKDYEYSSIDPHAEREDAQIIAFIERYQAELFVGEASKIAGIGDIELEWAPNTTTTGQQSGENPPVRTKFAMAPLSDDQDEEYQNPRDDDSITGNAVINTSNTPDHGFNGEADYDVADAEDRWRDL
ncbi:hypothetical protein P154DRAFT_426187 [Amniculicola lignicola CBS 123094]|uniref:C3H1-type domain-containing protein n=1 Tax=Amniculicola lignicola CBS 123094 TaxID=1392246 RepID=A0A6A5WWZ3_9PLEO|nr:hypothetical protein P154DRAFT_426187 [Amniculicola lignicola CBS 123094]